MSAVNDLIVSVATAAVFTALMEIIIGESSGETGFRTVCGMAIILSVMEAVCTAINL